MEAILGIHGFSIDKPYGAHDSGAAIIVDGEIVAAVNEERLSRKKTDGRFPHRSIEAVLTMASMDYGDIAHVAAAGLSSQRKGIKLLKYAVETSVEMSYVMAHRYEMGLKSLLVRRRMPKELSGKPITFVEHHEAHAACAYYAGPWEQATVVTLDGIGDASICGTASVGSNGRLERLWECNGYYSPGLLYAGVTQALGFTKNKHEGKITGLAAFGDPEACYAEFEAAVRYDQQRHQFWSPISMRFLASDWEDLSFVESLQKRFSREDIAAALQRRTEEVTMEYIRDAIATTGVPNVVLAGGVFANVKVNQRIREMPEVHNVYVHPHMVDGGLTVGAALKVWADEVLARGGQPRPRYLQNVYLGPEYSDSEIRTLLDRQSRAYVESQCIERDIAELLAQKRIVGRFNGRMEYGPRALGNRSILADPTDRSINDWLNQRLQRTEFMPFAPSLLEEDAPDYMAGWQPDHPASHFMTITYDVTPKCAQQAPAITHIDRTARPQVVRLEDNPSYHRIIREYKQLTGLPIIVNTSFNMHEEPIICSPEDALRSLDAGCVDVLAIGPFLVNAMDCE